MEERQAIRNDTLQGAVLALGLALQHVRRQALEEKGCIYWFRLRKDILEYMNLRMFGRK